MKGKRVLAILTSLVLTVGTLSVGAYAADGGGAASTTGKAAQAAAENPCAEGHDYVVKETAEPTCEKDGYTVYVCTRCEDTYTEKVDALDHDYQASETVAPTCEEDGYTVYTCTRCGDNYTEEGKKALGHAYKATETVAPTCEEDGYTVYTCTRCGDSYTDNEKEALGHKYKETARKDPTCTKKGSVTYTCSNCGDSYKEDLDALGHDFSGKPVTTKEATAEAEGEMTYYCTHDGCKETKVEKIPKLKVEDKKDDSKLITEEEEDETVKEEAKKNTDGTAVFYYGGLSIEGESGSLGPDDKASFKKEGEEYTLTLDGANLSYDISSANGEPPAAAVIEYTGKAPLKISVKGKNEITYTGNETNPGIGIKAANADVTIEGTKSEEDTLTINTVTGGAVLWAKSIKIEDPLGIISPEKGETGKAQFSSNEYVTILDNGAAAQSATIQTVTYTITYEGNSGTGTMNPGSVLKGNKYKLEDCGFTAPEGQEFEAWTIDGTDYPEGEEVPVTANTVATAKWKAKAVTTYKVTYKPGDHGEGSMADKEVNEGDELTLPKNGFNPKGDYEFDQWLIGSEKFDAGDSYTVKSNTTVTALWKEKTITPATKKYTVTYEPGDHGEGSMAGKEVDDGYELTLPKNAFTPKGDYEFDQWQIGQERFDAGDTYTVKENTTVTALWKATTKDCYLSFEPGEGSGRMDPVKMTYKYDEKKKKYSYTVKLPACTFSAPKGKVFDGWKIGENTFSAGISLKGFSSDSTATALWKEEGEDPDIEPDSYTITFDAGGGDGSMQNASVEEGKSYQLPECKFTAPSEDKCFDKWQIGDKTYAVEETVTITKDTKVTALWKAHEWGEAEYTWSEDNTTCSAKSTCKNCGDESTEQATVTKTSTATCEKDGTATYTAKFTKNTSWNTEKKVEEKALGHDWQNPKFTWTDPTSGKVTVTRTCSRDSSHTQSVEGVKVTGTATIPTEKENGKVTYTATVTIDGKEYTDTKEAAVEPAGTNKGYKFTVKPDSWTKRTTVANTNNKTTVSSSNTLSFTIKRDKFDVLTYSAFLAGSGVQIDGKKLENKNNSMYTAKKGSLILTFTPAYLGTLSAGSHTLKVNFKDGSVDTKFTVKGTSSTNNNTTNRTTNTTNRTVNSPRTGDYSNWAVWIGLIAVSVIGIGAIVYFKKRGKKSE